jgi:hypothetical protein
MKERLRKKMEDKKLKQAQAQALAQAQAVVQTQAPTNSFVVKIGEEKQEKSGLKAPLSDKELVDLFKNDKKDKKSKKGKK